MSFSGNPNLLVSSPTLQEVVIDDSTGQPAVNATVTFYQDNSRTTLKNVYYQTGAPGAYTYTALPNPLTLNGAGAVTDINGNDVMPYYYPYSELDNATKEPYYITVDNSNGQRLFTRANFPFTASSNSSSASQLTNLLVNNVFWRNIGSLNAGTLSNSITINGSTVYYAVLAPSAHDGYSMPDLQYVKNVNGATETITFTKFTANSDELAPDTTPEYYINHTCTAAAGGETLKAYQFPISLHLNTLAGQEATLTFYAQNGNGDPNNIITIYLYQFSGTGVTSPSPVAKETYNLSSDWTLNTLNFTFPSTPTTLGNGGDDAFYLQIGMPLGKACNINFTKPAIYLGNKYPTVEFQNYDVIDSVINTPRTGDVRTSLNSFNPYGWVLCNDGVISNSGVFVLPTGVPSARQNIDTWPLYNLIWSNTFIDVCPIYDVTGFATTKGASAIEDWSNNKQLQLSLILGRSLLGLPYAGTSTGYDNATGKFTITSAFSNFIYVGTPILLSGLGLPSAFSANTLYYAIPVDSNNIKLATTYANALAGTAITGGTAGTPNFTLTIPLGSSVGESRHTQLPTELASHTHTFSINDALASGAGVSRGGVADNLQAANLVLNNTGNSTPFNIVQPSTYLNVFFKL